MRLILMVFAVLTVTSPAGAASEFEIDVDGENRRYVVEMPRGPRPAPAIVILHGGAGTPDRMQRITRFTLHEQGWAEIYPEGIDGQWNDGRAGLDGTQLPGPDDLALIRAVIARLAGDGLIDPKRVFFTGASNGGAMTLRIVCQAPGLAAGAAIVIMNQPVGLDCPDGPPLPMLFIQGTDDPLVPFAGGPIASKGFKDRGAVLSATETLARFAQRNRCGPWEELAIPDLADDGTRVRLHAYRGCAAPLRQFIVDGGGHTWPGNRNRRWVEKLLGRTSIDISATFEIEAFFTEILGR